ncbi:DUF5384 family protein [Pantoea sp. KPR_PJ]|uniref:DUF5384 family protein n=1 Tax=Pantoea sp. KPR_PJ TaxID=2738375 RepID=UPI0035277821
MTLLSLVTLGLSATFNAQASSLQDQLAAVAAAENAGKAQQQALDDARQARFDREAREERARRARIAAASAERQRQRDAAAAAEKSRVLAENQADKKRDQSYEDELRQLELEQRKLALKREATRVAREDDYIDQELKSRAARTDVIQSEADATRNLSLGGRDLMQSEGKAREKKAGSWFN